MSFHCILKIIDGKLQKRIFDNHSNFLNPLPVHCFCIDPSTIREFSNSYLRSIEKLQKEYRYISIHFQNNRKKEDNRKECRLIHDTRSFKRSPCIVSAFHASENFRIEVDPKNNRWKIIIKDNLKIIDSRKNCRMNDISVNFLNRESIVSALKIRKLSNRTLWKIIIKGNISAKSTKIYLSFSR